MNEMFCYQCEQTAGGNACTGTSGVCGKKSTTAILQDGLTAALIDLAKTLASRAPTAAEVELFVNGLFMTGTNVNFDDTAIEAAIRKVRVASSDRGVADRGVAESNADCGDVESNALAMTTLWTAQEDIRSLKT